MNLFSITSLIIFVSSIGFGLSLYSGDRTLKVNREWFLFSLCLGLWSLGLFGVTWSDTAQNALAWQYVLDIAAIFIPVLYFSFASELAGLNNKKWRIFSYILAVLLSLFSLTPFFKEGVRFLYGSFYWINPGPVYIAFPIFFLAYVIACLVIYVKAYRKSTDRLFRSQMINMFLASAVGFGGGITNFLPQIFNIYPFGNFLVLLYLFFMSYGVLKYKFISKKIVSAQLLVGAVVLVFLFNLLQMLQTGSNATEESIWIGLLLLVLVSVFGVLIVRGVYREVEQREKIEALAEGLRIANDRLRELDTQKTEFISFATHQLRAPLTAIKGYASLMDDGDMGAMAPEARKAAERIFESASTMTNVVDDYLNVSRIELGSMKYSLEPLDMKKMVEEVVGELRPNIAKSRLDFSYNAAGEGPWMVSADPDKLKQVIANIIDNSVKYTPKGFMRVSLERVPSPDGTIPVRFSVADSGIGIAPEVMPKLFQKFSRAEGANKQNIHGTGLGLFIAREIVNAHKGKMWAESEGEGKGSKFIVELPAV